MSINGVLGARAASDQSLRLAIWAPAGWDRVCAAATTADGLYQARNAYVLPGNWSGGEVTLPFPTRNGDLLSKLSSDEFAVLVTRGDCDVPSDEIAVTYWRGTANPFGEVTILVNSFRADAVVAVVEADDQAHEIVCRRIEGPAVVAYDTSCVLPAVGRSATVQLVRVRDGTADDPVIARLSR